MGLPMGFPGCSVVKNLPINAGVAGDMGQEDPLEEEKGNPLHYTCLENPMGRGTWRGTVHRVTQNRTQLKQLSMHTHKYIYDHKDMY